MSKLRFEPDPSDCEAVTLTTFSFNQLKLKVHFVTLVRIHKNNKPQPLALLNVNSVFTPVFKPGHLLVDSMIKRLL